MQASWNYVNSGFRETEQKKARIQKPGWVGLLQSHSIIQSNPEGLLFCFLPQQTGESEPIAGDVSVNQREHSLMQKLSALSSAGFIRPGHECIYSALIQIINLGNNESGFLDPVQHVYAIC